MFRNFYLDRDTIIHKLDPRIKICCMLILSLILFIFNDPLYVGIMTAGCFAVGAVARSLTNVLRMRSILILFVLISFISWQFYLQGPTVIAHIGPVTLTREVLFYGFAAGLRYMSLLVVGIIFISVIKIEEIMLGMTGLGVPYPVAFVFSLAVRLVPTFVSTILTITEAQVARGLDLETRNPIRRGIRLIPVLVPFLIYAIRYASHLSMALEARGFSPSKKRTYYLELNMTIKDIIILLGLLGLGVVLLLVRLKGYGAILPGRI